MTTGIEIKLGELTRIAVAGGFYQYSKEMELKISHAYDLLLELGCYALILSHSSQSECLSSGSQSAMVMLTG